MGESASKAALHWPTSARNAYSPQLLIVQAGGDQAQQASADLLLVVQLFARLAQSAASIGQDVLRVKHVTSQTENAEEGADALDLACQTADALCQLQSPNVELLGMHSCIQWHSQSCLLSSLCAA